MTVEQAARCLKCTAANVRYLCRTGKIKAEKREGDRGQLVWEIRYRDLKGLVDPLTKTGQPARKRGWVRGCKRSNRKVA